VDPVMLAVVKKPYRVAGVNTTEIQKGSACCRGRFWVGNGINSESGLRELDLEIGFANRRMGARRKTLRGLRDMKSRAE